MTKDLTKLSDMDLMNAWYDLNMDSQHYQDRQMDHGDDCADELDAIDAEMEEIRNEQDRRESALEKKAEEHAYDRMVEA